MTTVQLKTGQHASARPSTTAIRRPNSLGTRLFFGGMFFSIFYGWLNYEDFYLSAENGLGYYLGIAGGMCMLILLLYPLRKKLRSLKNFGPIKHWFKIHMALGIIGPTLILYHASFSLGSVNSNVALICMLTVSLSGLVGRFIYTHIHYGLYGEKMTLEELKTGLDQSRTDISQQFSSFPEIQSILSELEEMVAKRRHFITQILWLPVMSASFYFKRNKIKKILKQDIKNNKSELTAQHINSFKEAFRTIYNYIETSKRLGQLMTYERLFSLWHILHLPLFFMLIITGFIHVIAVHMY
jgi:hypothetical protein